MNIINYNKKSTNNYNVFEENKITKHINYISFQVLKSNSLGECIENSSNDYLSQEYSLINKNGDKTYYYITNVKPIGDVVDHELREIGLRELVAKMFFQQGKTFYDFIRDYENNFVDLTIPFDKQNYFNPTFLFKLEISYEVYTSFEGFKEGDMYIEMKEINIL